MFTKIDDYTMEETVTEEKKQRYTLPKLIGNARALGLAIQKLEGEKAGVQALIDEARNLGLQETMEEI